ncbi:unnamed protein product, partial [Symbiodinium sp. KB8]
IPALVSAIAICLPAVFATEALQSSEEEAICILFVRSMELAVDCEGMVMFVSAGWLVCEKSMNQQCVFGVRCSFLRKCNETSAHDIVNLSAMYRLMNQTEGEQPQAEAGKLKDNMLNMLDVDPDDNGAGGAGAEDLEHPLTPQRVAQSSLSPALCLHIPAASMLDLITILSAAGLQQELGNAFDGRSLVINEQESGSPMGEAAEQVSDTLEAIDNTLASGLTAATGSVETAAEHLSNIFDGVETILGDAASALLGGSCSSESSEPAPSKSVD